jgi:hypothetical protein
MRLDELEKFGWTYKDGYGHYELNAIATGERKNLKAMQGMNERWEIESIPVIPLNGWRGRNLAELVFGERNDGHWALGVSKLVRVKDLLELPDWDGANERHLKEFSGVVAIEVVIVDPGYGVYIHITPMEHSHASEVEQGHLAEVLYEAHQEAHRESLKNVLEELQL